MKDEENAQNMTSLTDGEELQETEALPKVSRDIGVLRHPEKLEKLKKKYEKRGIVYISRLPPRMKPQKLRHMLEQYARIERLYLAPEDPLVRKKRKKRGGNSGKNFTEGWVEFADKAEAKRVAAALNGEPMGGKRRSAHYYDLWCMKYLPKFKWDHLTEEINYQKAIRDQKMEAELAAAKRERDFYLSRVDKAKAVTAIAERKNKKRKSQETDNNVDGNHADNKTAIERDGSDDRKAGIKLRSHTQRQPKPDPVEDVHAPKISRGVLEMVAGKSKS